MAFGNFLNFLFGKGEELQQVPRFTQPQQDIFSQLQQGVSGAIPQGFEQLLSILGGSPEAARQFEAPAMRQFEEQILPTIAERFTGLLGEGAQRSSAFGQQLGQAGAGLAETLQAERGGRQQNALTQLMQLMQTGLTPQFQTLLRQRQPGLLETGAKGAATAVPSLLYGGI